MRSSLTRILPLAAAVAFAACGSDVIAPETDLTPEERAILGSALFSQALSASLGVSLEPPAAAEGPDGAPVNFTRTVQVTLPCQISGDVATDASVEGTADDETGEVDVTFSVTQDHNDCTFSGNGQQILINGTPGTSFEFDFTTDGVGGFAGSGSLVGSVDYVIGDRSGSCSTDLAFSGSGDETGGGYVVSGTVCGANLTIDVASDG